MAHHGSRESQFHGAADMTHGTYTRFAGRGEGNIPIEHDNKKQRNPK